MYFQYEAQRGTVDRRPVIDFGGADLACQSRDHFFLRPISREARRQHVTQPPNSSLENVPTQNEHKEKTIKELRPEGSSLAVPFFSPSPARQPGCFCQAIGCFYSRDCLGTAGRAEKDGNVQLRRQTRAAPEFMQMSVRHLSALRCFFLNRRWTERPIHIKHGRCCTAIRVRESRKREHDANYHSRNLDGSILYDRLFCRRLF